MMDFLNAYFATAAPNMIVAMSVATVGFFVAWRLRGGGLRSALGVPLLMAIGIACATVAVISIGGAIFGIQFGDANGTLGIIAGIVAALALARPEHPDHSDNSTST